jgi:polysaccharide biosynthesis transport protein
MLKIERSRFGKDAEALQPEVSSSQKELWNAVNGFLRRHSSIFMLVLPLALSLGVVYVFVAPIKYTAKAELIIDIGKVQSFELLQPPASTAVTADPIAVDTQVQVLKSEGIASSVIKDLHLVGDPEFTGVRGSLFHPLVKMISSLFGSPKPKTSSQLEEAALGIFKKNLTIVKSPGTYLIEIYYLSLGADRAATIANAVAEAYISSLLEAKYQAAQRATIWLQKRSDELREQVSAAERAAVDYRANNNILDTGGAEKKLVNQQQLGELTSALIQARGQTAEAKARMDRANSIILARRADDAKMEPPTIADSLHNEVITRLRENYLDLSVKEAEFSSRYGKQHLAVIRIREKMRDINDSIDSELHRISETYKSEYEIAKSREEAAQKGLSDIVLESNATSEAQITLHTLESYTQTYRNLYENLMQRYTASIQQQTFPLTEARIITSATAPTKNCQPNFLVVVSISLVGGLLSAFCVGAFRDMSDHVFRTVGQIETAIQAECIGVLPIVKQSINSSPANSRQAQGPRTIARAPIPFWQIVDTPFSQFSEAIRSMKMAADLYGISRSNKVIGVTSSLPKEGKSTLAAALALNIAIGQSRVVLVDCDLRNPSLSRCLAPNAKEGLLEVLSDWISVDEVIWKDPSTNMAFLPVVMESPIAHSGDVLGAVRTTQLFENLRERYDYIVVDLSPLAPVADVRATAGFIDSYIFVIEWGKTKIEMTERVLKSASGVYERLIGVALNKANENWLRRFGSYHGQYYPD